MQAHINELHYDNSGADTGEAVEVAGPAGLSLDGSSIVFYSSGGSQYKSTSLSGTIPDCGALSFEVSGIQNGVCGLVLVAADGTLGPLLSYEGVLTATGGPAAGVTSTDIGVAESSATPVGSLQLQGDGSTWAVGATSSFGALNAGQSCASSPPSPPPSLPSPPVAPCPPRSELRQSLIGHTAYPYTSSSTDTWDVLREADAAATDATLVYLLYANATTDGAQEYNGGAGWSREHLWPQSLAEYHASDNDPPATDLHALRAALQSCNSHRSNRLFGEVADDNGGWAASRADCPHLMCESSGACEPHDALKGEIARALMYMALRYDGVDDLVASGSGSGVVQHSWRDLQLVDVATGGEEMLVRWSEQHPPSADEARRDGVVASYQGIANPFVATPALALCRYDATPEPATPPSPPAMPGSAAGPAPSPEAPSLPPAADGIPIVPLAAGAAAAALGLALMMAVGAWMLCRSQGGAKGPPRGHRRYRPRGALPAVLKREPTSPVV